MKNKHQLIIWFLMSLPLLVHSQITEYVKPEYIQGVNNSSINLNGKWQFQYSPKSKWVSVNVPGELAMQGYAIEHDQPVLYKKTVQLPEAYNNHKIIIRFDGVYSYARLWVNGTFVRNHNGGFTRWEADITAYAKPGKKNEIKLEVIDPKDEISYASGYAHHPVGGILRDVTLYALPQTHWSNLSVETELDSLYRDANLQLEYTASRNGVVEYELSDPQGRKVSLAQHTYPISQGKNSQSLSIPNPLKWTAEHPNLYTLHVRVKEEGKSLYGFERKIGFRKIEVVNDRMLVNGQPVKLRGACRHDIHPQLGRASTAELDSLDVQLFKQSNMNFVRTSHYPPSDKFLEYCDKYGIYVECETAVCFVNTHRQKNYAPGNTESDEAYTDKYLSQLQEMVTSYRNHSSVVIWSIGNECVYGSNFQQSWDWIKAADKTRPAVFSYPGSVKQENKIYDILSMHYQDTQGNLNQWGMSTWGFQGHGIPALFDEWAHPACYTYATLQTDPNIREFWAQSIDKMWSGLFNARGGLGGAIWGYVDEIFMLPEPKEGTAYWKEFAKTAKPADVQGNCVGYGEWGIVDIWRRPKPEFWATKKAYSPVKLLTTRIDEFASGSRLVLPVYNRYDHTCLSELNIRFTYRGKQASIKQTAIAPHSKGVLIVPAHPWKEGEQLLVEFLDKDNQLIDAENITLGKRERKLPAPNHASTMSVVEEGEQIIIKGDNYEIPFSKKDGLIHNATVNNRVFIEKGPFLNLFTNLNHLSGAEVRKTADKIVVQESDWQFGQITYTKGTDQVVFHVKGSYNSIRISLEIAVHATGKMDINYYLDGQPNGYLREAGLFFHLPPAVSGLEWEREGYWSYYPENEFAGNNGKAHIYNSKQAKYGVKPVQPWAYDTHNYYYWADRGANTDKPLTQMAKGMKEHIYYYTLSDGNNSFSAVSPHALLACRINKNNNDQLIWYVNNYWDYPEIAWGNYCKRLEAVPCFGTIRIIF